MRVHDATGTDSVQSSVILDHAGDVYEKIGDSEKALEYWERALAAAEDDADEINEKILKYKKEEK